MHTLSVIIPCYNEEKTLNSCIERVRSISDENLNLEIIIVDDCSSDASYAIARDIRTRYPDVQVFRHEKNQGKGAALRTGFRVATGDFVAIQDADLEYNPLELKTLLVPLVNDEADVVFGSRFLSGKPHRVLYFWHFLGNSLLTLLSNMFTDLNLSDVETCYKVFRRELIQRIDLRENRFGFEVEIVAKIAHLRPRIYEMGISYYGRTYEEGKKIGFKDGLRALYGIVRYNAHYAPLPMQFLVYALIGGLAALVNLFVFLGLHKGGAGVFPAAPIAFAVAALFNYVLCLLILFRHRVRWGSVMEILIFLAVVAVIGGFDLLATTGLIDVGLRPGLSKMLASILGLALNFAGRRFLVFPEPPSGPWNAQATDRPK
jgi:dolichol-phosphate mannosyltransferase